MAERPDPYPDETDERIRKLSREKEELKNKVTMETEARCLAEHREQDTKEQLRVSNRDNVLLKEQLSSTNYALADQKRENELLKGIFSGSQQGNELELGNAGEMTRNVLEKKVLIESIQVKDSVITGLRDQVRDLQRDVRKKCERTTEEKSVATSEVKRLKEMCDKLFVQVTGLIVQQQESEDERSSLLQIISDLREEIDVLHVTRESTHFSLN